MVIRLLKNIILAFALPSLRISPLLTIRIATIALLYAAAVTFIVVYIKSIGSGIGIFSGLFYDVQGFNTGSISIEPLLEPTAIALSSLVPVKPGENKPSRRLTNLEKSQFTLSDELKQILVGLLLGDLHINKQKLGINPRLMFIQGLINESYLLYLYELFKSYSPQVPRISNNAPDKRTGKIYNNINFQYASYSIDKCYSFLTSIFLRTYGP